MKRILTLTLAALLLLTACAAPSEDAANTTTTAATTTTAPETTYRPDLEWAVGYIMTNQLVEIVKYHRAAGAHTTKRPVPCKVDVYIYAEPNKNITEHFTPTEYLASIQWEVLPEDAWNYVNGCNEPETIFAAPNGKAFASFDIEQMMEFYQIDPSILENKQIHVDIEQARLKSTESIEP